MESLSLCIAADVVLSKTLLQLQIPDRSKYIEGVAVIKNDAIMT